MSTGSSEEKRVGVEVEDKTILALGSSHAEQPSKTEDSPTECLTQRMIRETFKIALNQDIIDGILHQDLKRLCNIKKEIENIVKEIDAEGVDSYMMAPQWLLDSLLEECDELYNNLLFVLGDCKRDYSKAMELRAKLVEKLHSEDTDANKLEAVIAYSDFIHDYACSDFYTEACIGETIRKEYRAFRCKFVSYVNPN